MYILSLCLAFRSAELVGREREREREGGRGRESELGFARACHMCGNSDLRQLERLVEVFEKSLVKLRKVESWGLWIFGVRVGIGLHET